MPILSFYRPIWFYYSYRDTPLPVFHFTALPLLRPTRIYRFAIFILGPLSVLPFLYFYRIGPDRFYQFSMFSILGNRPVSPFYHFTIFARLPILPF